MKKLVLFSILLASLYSQITQIAFAGGSAAEFKITHFHASNDHFTFNLIATSRPLYDKCHSLTVSGSYDYVYWLWQSLRFHTPSRNKHMDALHRLKTAYENDQTIEYGWMGWRSLQKEENGFCEVGARALYVNHYDAPQTFLSQIDTI